ncbi:MAG: cation:proton antiporter, partial [Rickettsiales bacterium]|nr:cation:proton antiporter [Rickettsiales bacterium]
MHDISYLFNIVALLFTAVFVVVIFRQFRLSPVLGYLVAGAAIGENGLDYIHSTDVALLAEFGVVFLLFMIGIELTIERLMSMRNHVFGFGGLQVLLTGLFIYYIARLFGMDVNSSIIIGGAFALSSTAMVMGILTEKGIQSNQVGRLSISVLLMQDFAVVPLLILVPLLNSSHESSLMSVLGSSMLEACVGMVIIFFIGRMIIRPIFKLIVATKNEELFIATTLLLVLGASYATHAFNLSLALGAFIAGLLVAETQYNLQVEESIKPFKSLLLGLFFMSVGMTINLTFIGEKLMIILLLSLCLIIVKAAIIMMLCKLFKFTLGAAIQSGLLLSQGSEFAFVLFTLSQQEGVLNTETSQILLMIVTTTMAVTPLLVQLGTKLADKVDNKEINITQSSSEFSDMERFVIICGFGRVGKMVSRLFSEHRLNYIVMDINAQTVLQGKKAGYPIFRGDAGRSHTLKEIELDRAEAVIVTIPNIITCE